MKDLAKEEIRSLSLLEYLAAQSGCMYLSDLHQPYNLFFVQRAVSRVPPSDYSLWEWKDAVHYITGQVRNFQTQEQAKRYLRDFTLSEEGGM